MRPITSGQDSVHARCLDPERAALEHELGRLHQRAAGRDLVVDDQGVLALDVADQAGGARDRRRRRSDACR